MNLTSGVAIANELGGAGADNLTGGLGADRFVWGADALGSGTTDTIGDFQQGSDRLDLSGIDAKPAMPGTDDAFVLVGSRSLGVEGEIVQSLFLGQRLVLVFVDGDAVEDLAVVLGGVTASLTGADFVL